MYNDNIQDSNLFRFIAESFSNNNREVSAEQQYLKAFNCINESVKNQSVLVCNQIIDRIDFTSSNGGFSCTVNIPRNVRESVMVCVKDFLRRNHYIVSDFSDDYNYRLIITWGHLGGLEHE